MTELSRHAEKSTEALRALDSWHSGERTAIMQSGTLTPAAKRERLEALRKDYRERWFLAKQAAEKDLAEWDEIYESRAASALEPKAPQDREAAMLRALDLQRLHGRIERHKDDPGRLLAEYDRAIRTGNHHVAHELEDALPALLPESARADFTQRAREERYKRLPEAERKKVEEAEAWRRERMATGLGLAMQETHRARGYAPSVPAPTTLMTHVKPGEPPVVHEIPDTRWRDPSRDLPANEPTGGTVV